MKKIKSLAIIANLKNEGASVLSEQLHKLALKEGIESKTTCQYPVPKDFLKGMDACCAIGGDGTILALLKQAVEFDVPILGIQRGKLGFLAALAPSEVKLFFSDIVQGGYKLGERALLECVSDTGESGLGLNDVVLKSLTTSRLVQLHVFANGEPITKYSCDGLIFSTPTGSTAYNLSAGGPIIHPELDAITMTPICPHTLSNRSFVFNKEVLLKVTSPDPEIIPQISIDGRIFSQNEDLFPFHIKISKRTFKLIQPVDYSYYRILRSKLKWGALDLE